MPEQLKPDTHTVCVDDGGRVLLADSAFQLLLLWGKYYLRAPTNGVCELNQCNRSSTLALNHIQPMICRWKSFPKPYTF